MKKSVVILLIVVQIILLFIFQNIYFLYKEFEKIDVNDVKKNLTIMENIKKMKRIFSILSIITGFFLIITGIYLGFLYKKSKGEINVKEIPLLQNYLSELKDSQVELKDILEEQQEKVLRKEELNKSIINNINSAIIFLNNFNRIDIFNLVAEKLFSKSFAHAKNNTVDEIFKTFPELVKFINKNKNLRISSEIASTGKIFWLDLIPMENIGVLIIIKDITEDRKREEIESKNKNFIMLGEMTAFLAHEVKNSLGAIYGYSRTIESEIKKSEKKQLVDKINKVNKEINLLSIMMESFLNFSKPVSIEKREQTDLKQLLEKLADEQGLGIEFLDKDLKLETDPILIKSVFSNLLLNAKEAEATKIKIDFNEGEFLEIFLKDNGKGIQKEIWEKVWLPLFTTKEKGTGMGLPMVRKILNSIHGDIQLVKSSSEGSVFRIFFFPTTGKNK
jgi:nitrogen fixation/metabolism regulation signal transduction histidine kinase